MNVRAVAPHACRVRPRLAAAGQTDPEKSALVVRAGQRQPLRLRLSHRLLRCHRWGQGHGGAGGSPPLGCSRDVQRRLLSCGEDAEMNVLAVAPHTCLVRPRLAAGRTNPVKPALAVRAGQRKPLRLRLRQRLLRRHRRGQGRAVCRLGRSGDVQRRLLSRGEDAEVNVLAVAPHVGLVRPRLALSVHSHVAKPALAIGAGQRQSLRLRLRPRLLRCHRRGQVRGGTGSRPRLGRSGEVQRRLLGRGEATEEDLLAVALHVCLVRPHLAARSRKHVAKPARVIRAGQRQPLRLRLRQSLLRCHRRWQGRRSLRLGRPRDVQRRLLGRRGAGVVDWLAVARRQRPPLAVGLRRHVAAALVGQRYPIARRLGALPLHLAPPRPSRLPREVWGDKAER
eukprot:scaffold16518_cov61-Phaeocystis_antarctica.AAC.2